MTFYNIIFGILFLAACQATLWSLDTSADTLFLAFVALLIFSDAVNTSETVETRAVDYGISMKLFDLGSFLAIGTALVLIGETTKTFVDKEIYTQFPAWMQHPSVPAGLLFLYCVFVAGWDFSAGLLEKEKLKTQWDRPLVVGVCMITASIIGAGILRWFDWHRGAGWPLVIYRADVVAGLVGALLYLWSYTRITRESHLHDDGGKKGAAHAEAAGRSAADAKAAAEAAAGSATDAAASANKATNDANRAADAASRADVAARSIPQKPQPIAD